MNLFMIPLQIISDNKKYFEEIANNENIIQKIISQLLSMTLFFFIYGFIIGLSCSFLQGISSAIKLPLLFLLTLSICTPTLYIFNILFGSKMSFLQHFVLLLSMQSVTSIFLIAFSPITLFFEITGKNYQFFKLLNVVIFGIAGFIGVCKLNRGIKISNYIINSKYTEAQKEKVTNKLFIILWITIYGFVGSQLSWILRPFFGVTKLKFELFRNFNGNFYYNIIQAIIEIIGMK